MKKLLSTFVALAISSLSFAQLQLATLEHDSTVSVYYGATALQEAHAAAVDGDIITLSPGMFSATDLTKLVTVRGAGMFNDTAAGVVRTTINGTFNLGSDSVNVNSPYHLTLEGLYFNSSVKLRRVYSPYLVKCYFQNISYQSSNHYFSHGQVVNCIIAGWDDSGYEHVISTSFVNCVVINNHTYYSDNCTYTNCIVKITNNYSGHKKNQFNNSILFYDNTSTNAYHDNSTPYYWNSYSSDYCIGINYNSDSTKIYYGILPVDRHLHNYKTFDAVFKTFNGTIQTDEVNYELQDSIASTILGNDGTQVGIYGGPMPFDPYVYNHKVTAARRTTPDGFLDLEIKLYDEE